MSLIASSSPLKGSVSIELQGGSPHLLHENEQSPKEDRFGPFSLSYGPLVEEAIRHKNEIMVALKDRQIEILKKGEAIRQPYADDHKSEKIREQIIAFLKGESDVVDVALRVKTQMQTALSLIKRDPLSVSVYRTLRELEYDTSAIQKAEKALSAAVKIMNLHLEQLELRISEFQKSRTQVLYQIDSAWKSVCPTTLKDWLIWSYPENWKSLAPEGAVRSVKLIAAPEPSLVKACVRDISAISETDLSCQALLLSKKKYPGRGLSLAEGGVVPLDLQGASSGIDLLVSKTSYGSSKNFSGPLLDSVDPESIDELQEADSGLEVNRSSSQSSFFESRGESNLTPDQSFATSDDRTLWKLCDEDSQYRALNSYAYIFQGLEKQVSVARKQIDEAQAVFGRTSLFSKKFPCKIKGVEDRIKMTQGFDRMQEEVSYEASIFEALRYHEEIEEEYKKLKVQLEEILFALSLRIDERSMVTLGGLRVILSPIEKFHSLISQYENSAEIRDLKRFISEVSSAEIKLRNQVGLAWYRFMLVKGKTSSFKEIFSWGSDHYFEAAKLAKRNAGFSGDSRKLKFRRRVPSHR